MIIRKCWMHYSKNHPNFRYEYMGYFLLGLIPIYIERKTVWR